jgi:hypothetical protein
MTTTLGKVLADLAAEADTVVDPDRALASARRARRWRAVAACTAILALVAAIPISAAGLRRIHGTDSVVAGETMVIDAPAASSPATLPRGKLTPARLAYRTCAPVCATRVVLRDGRQYTLPQTDQDPVVSVRISPDGHRLVWTSGHLNQTKVRDLVTGDEVTLPPMAVVVAWSPDGSDVWGIQEGGQLVRGGLDGANPVTLPNPTRYGYLIRPESDRYQYLTVEQNATGLTLTPRSLYRDTAGDARHVDWKTMLQPGDHVDEAVAAAPPLHMPGTDVDKGGFAIPVSDAHAGHEWSLRAMLVVDLTHGAAIRRVPVADPSLSPIAYRSDGIIATQLLDAGNAATGPKPATQNLVRIDTTTGVVSPYLQFARPVMANITLPDPG